jgi:hypothetical protein
MSLHVNGLRICLIIVAIFAFACGLWAQSTTTATIIGKITTTGGEPLPGANILLVHEPSGTQYGTTSRVDGDYTLANLRVGGPYRLTVTYVGYQTQERPAVYLQLSQTATFNFPMYEQAIEAEEVVVTGEASPILNAGRTGAATNVTREQIEYLPTISRSFQDLLKISPYFVGNNAAGRNFRFNNYQIDGSVYNDLFGLGESKGIPGGQTGTNPVSLDALQEFQVVIAPYDVRQSGFTGGGINAITRSGTNAFSGSAYVYGRNEELVGKDPVTNAKLANFDEFQTGFRIGGPILESKLFFFVNAEIQDRKEPKTTVFTAPGVTGSNVSPIPEDSVKKFVDILKNQYGYDPGSYNPFTDKTKNQKFFARLDWNLSDQHRVTFRYNYTKGADDNIPQTTTRYYLENSNYVFKDVTNSAVLQLKSTFGNDMSNELILGYTTIRDKRETPGAAFPFVRVSGISAVSADLNGGTENFSIANTLDQDIFEVTDNFSYWMGDHTFTIGTHNEFFGFENLYIRDYYGNYEFSDMTNFQLGRPSRYYYSYSLTSNPRQSAKFNVMQFGGYVQDEWAVVPNVKLTLGLRVDVPIFPDKPTYNPKIDSTFAAQSLSTDEVPSGNVLWSPRIGFNWDVAGDRVMQVRGGLGIFTGRVAYVWISNQYGNTGMEFARIDTRSSSVLVNGFFTGDPYNPPRPAGTVSATTEVDLTDKDFKMPQVWRANLAFDRQLPLNLVATLEGVYSTTKNDILYQDVNMGPQVATMVGDGRPIYGAYSLNASTGVGSFTTGKVNLAFTNVILMKNTDKGYQYYLTAQIQGEPLKDVMAPWPHQMLFNAAYTYGMAKDLNSTVSSQAFSQWRYNHVPGNPNDPPLAYSAFDIRHRVFVSITYSADFVQNWGTTISLFYNGQSGAPFSYVYDGDVNGDGQIENDLIYVPKDKNDIILVDPGARTVNLPTSDARYDQLMAYIDRDEALSDQRGKIFERMSAREPWTDRVDLHIGQQIPLFGTHRFEITADILNFLNMLNSDWGQVKYVDTNRYRLLKFENLEPGTNRPRFSYGNVNDPYMMNSLSSRWQVQLGLRYTF